MVTPYSVLIVDRQDETREVLRTVLSERGIEIFEAQRPDQGLRLARQHHPDLIVLDLEVEDPQIDPAGEPSAALVAESRASDTPLVVLGSVRRFTAGEGPEAVVAKPYHYGPLIRRIEELLARRRQAA